MSSNQNQINYFLVRLLSQMSQTVVKPKPKQLSNSFQHSNENCSKFGVNREITWCKDINFSFQL